MTPEQRKKLITAIKTLGGRPRPRKSLKGGASGGTGDSAEVTPSERKPPSIQRYLKGQLGGIGALYQRYFNLYDRYNYDKNEGLGVLLGVPSVLKGEAQEVASRITQLDSLIREGDQNKFSANLGSLMALSGLEDSEINDLLQKVDPKPLLEQTTALMESLGQSAPAPAPAPVDEEEEKEDINDPTPKEPQAMSKAEGGSMEMEIDADGSQTPAPKVSLRGVRVKGGTPKAKVTIKSVKRVEKPRVEPSGDLMKDAERVLGKERLDEIIKEGNERLDTIIEEENLKLQEGTDEVMEKLVKDAQEKRKAASERLSKTIEDIPEQLPQELPEEPLGEPEKAPIKMRVNKVTELKKDVLPTAVDLIPPERLSSEDKTVQQLKDDIDYFYINFPEKLRRVKKISSNNLQVLQRFHKRVVALLRGDKVDRDAEKQVGVIIKGESYIKDVLKEIILENSINGLSASDLLVNIEGEPNVEKPSAGDYEFKVNPTTGKEFADAQPVSRLIPTTDPQQTDAMKATYKKPISRIPMPKTMYRGPEVTARNQVAANPFLEARQPKIRLKYSY